MIRGHHDIQVGHVILSEILGDQKHGVGHYDLLLPTMMPASQLLQTTLTLVIQQTEEMVPHQTVSKEIVIFEMYNYVVS